MICFNNSTKAQYLNEYMLFKKRSDEQLITRQTASVLTELKQ